MSRPVRLALTLFLLAGCSISTSVQIEDTPLHTKPISRIIPSGGFEAVASINGLQLAVAVRQPATCESGEAQIVRRKEHTLREAHPSPWAFVGPGLAVTGLGIGAFFGAPALASYQAIPYLPGSALSYQVAGGIVAGGGLALVITGIVHAARARDRHRDLGEVALPPQIATRSCPLPLSARTEATLALSSSTKLRTIAPPGAPFRFSMLDVPSAHIPSGTSPLLMAVGGRDLLIELTREQALDLREALLRDERAVARRELTEQRRQECAALAGLAENMPPAHTAEQAGTVATAWDSTRRTCGDLFTADMEGKRAEAHQAKERADIEAARFASAVEVTSSDQEEELNGKVVKLETTLASADADAGYIEISHSETVCMRDAESDLKPRTHWGRGKRGGGGGGGKRGGGGWRRSWRSGWERWRNSHGSSSKKSSGTKHYTYRYRNRGSYGYSAPSDESDSAEVETEAPAPKKKCRTVSRKLTFRLAHPPGVRLAKNDFVRLYALATRSPKAHQLYLVDPKILVLTRSDKVLLGAVDARGPM